VAVACAISLYHHLRERWRSDENRECWQYVSYTTSSFIFIPGRQTGVPLRLCSAHYIECGANNPSHKHGMGIVWNAECNGSAVSPSLICERSVWDHLAFRWHWITIFFYAGILVVPSWRIVKKAGYAGAWSLLAVVPLLNIVLLWVFAFGRWPKEQPSA
jgi:hypothetical protein